MLVQYPALSRVDIMYSYLVVPVSCLLFCSPLGRARAAVKHNNRTHTPCCPPHDLPLCNDLLGLGAPPPSGQSPFSGSSTGTGPPRLTSPPASYGSGPPSVTPTTSSGPPSMPRRYSAPTQETFLKVMHGMDSLSCTTVVTIYLVWSTASLEGGGIDTGGLYGRVYLQWEKTCYKNCTELSAALDRCLLTYPWPRVRLGF